MVTAVIFGVLMTLIVLKLVKTIKRMMHKFLEEHIVAWADVTSEDQVHSLEPVVRATLQGHGFIGAATVSAPGASLGSALTALAGRLAARGRRLLRGRGECRRAGRQVTGPV